MAEELKGDSPNSAETSDGQSEILQKCLQTYQKVITSHEQPPAKIEQTI